MLVMMYDETRLDELEYQREQVRRHLEWIDREIEAERRKHPLPADTPLTSAKPTGLRPRAASTDRAPIVSPSPIAAPSDALLMETPRGATEVRQDVKKGCLLYFAAALAAVMFSVALLYFAFGVGRR